MTKAEQIIAKSNKPIEVGDFVSIQAPYTTKEIITEGRGKNKITKTMLIKFFIQKEKLKAF